MDQQHEMVLETTHSSGAEEWFCPTCGRRFLMQWPPVYKKIVLEVGDENAAHIGDNNEFPLEAIEMIQSIESIGMIQPGEDIQEESLRFWQKALEDIDLDDLEDDTTV